MKFTDPILVICLYLILQPAEIIILTCYVFFLFFFHRTTYCMCSSVYCSQNYNIKLEGARENAYLHQVK